MRAAVLTLVRCPVTGATLRLFIESASPAPVHDERILKGYDPGSLEVVVRSSNVSHFLPPGGQQDLAGTLMSVDVTTGALYTADRLYIYPIVGGIPRLLPPDLCRHPREVERYRSQLTGDGELPSREGPVVAPQLPGEWRQILEHNITSYTLQWDVFDYSERTWGYTVEERFSLMKKELGIVEEMEVAGKRLVDAACGNGSPALRMAEAGLEVFAFDQSHSVERADAFARQRGLPRRGMVHFIQGNLVAPPLAIGAFDLLYSGGAIHMTPNFRHTLNQLASLIKPCGSRMYVWSGRRRPIMGRVYHAIRIFLSLFPLPVREQVARVGVIPYMMIQFVLRCIYGEKAFPKSTFNENLVRFLDAASHRFGQIPSAKAFEAMVAELKFDSQETMRPSHRGYGILARRNA